MGLADVYFVKETWKIYITFFSAVLFLPVFTPSLRENSVALSLVSALSTPTWTDGSPVLRVLSLTYSFLCLYVGEFGSLVISAYLKIRNPPSQP